MELLLNWLIQGTVVAIGAAAGLKLIPASRAQARYGFVWAAYLVVCALPFVPALLALAGDAPAVPIATVAAGPLVTMPASWWTSPVVFISLLAIWSVLCAMRFAAGIVAVHLAKRHGHECPGDVLSRLPHWSVATATGRSVRVVLSDRVRFAAVLGCGAPVIAVAPGLVADLDPADLDRILVHEWAHVQRHDDVAQFIQRLAWIAVGWHPAAWWFDRQLESEREAACDDLAVQVTGSAKAYAACLAALAALPQAPMRSMPVLAAVSPSRIRRRLVRILAAPRTAQSWRSAPVCAGFALVALGFAVANLRVAAFTPVLPAIIETRLQVDRYLAPAPIVTDSKRSSPPLHRRSPDRRARPVAIDTNAPHDISALFAAGEPPAPVPSPTPLPSVTLAAGAAFPGLAAAPSPRVAGERAAETPAPWTSAANGGVAIGRASQNAGLATAGFFNRFGKSIARSF